MAKRAAPNEQPFRPLLDTNMVSKLIQQDYSDESEPENDHRPSGPTAKIVEMPLAEISQRERYSQTDRDMALRHNESSSKHLAPLARKLEGEKRILFTQQETQSLDRLIASLAIRLQCQVKVSHVVRALVALLLHAESHVDKRAGETGPLVRPSNADAQAIQTFEKEIAKLIAGALRDAGPLR